MPKVNFIYKLYELVNDPRSNHLISWGDSGTNFEVYNDKDFAKNILPCYFKHNQFSSFLRQLNQYDFQKIHPARWLFSHPNFKKNQTKELSSIFRKKQEKFNKNSSFSGPQQNFEEKTSMEINLLKKQKQVLTKNILYVFQLQNELSTRLEYLESNQKKIQTEINNLKSLIFRYFSKILSNEPDKNDPVKCFFSKKIIENNSLINKNQKSFHFSSKFQPKFNLSYQKKPLTFPHKSTY